MKRLRELRKKKKLSQRKLAEEIYSSQQSIYKYENGIAFPDIKTLISLADFFNTSVDYLIGYTDIPHKIEPVSFHQLNKDEEELLKCYRKLRNKMKSAVHRLVSEISSEYEE